MDNQTDAAWDDFGVRWRALEPDLDVIHQRLQGRIRRQSGWMTVGLWLLGAMSIVGLLLGSATVWSGWQSGAWNFVVRGAAILFLAMVLAASTRSLILLRSATLAASLAQLLTLSIQRARGLARLAVWGLWACGAVGLFGLLGVAIRTRISGPPTMSPVIDLMILAMIAAVLLLCRRLAQARGRDYDRLMRALID